MAIISILRTFLYYYFVLKAFLHLLSEKRRSKRKLPDSLCCPLAQCSKFDREKRYLNCPFPAVPYKVYWLRCHSLGALETVGTLVCCGVFFCFFYQQSDHEMALLIPMCVFDVCYNVNKSFSSEHPVLKPVFSNQKETKISAIWTSQNNVIAEQTMRFSMSSESFPEKLSWKNILLCVFQLYSLSSHAVGLPPPLQWTVPHTGHLNAVA